MTNDEMKNEIAKAMAAGDDEEFTVNIVETIKLNKMRYLVFLQVRELMRRNGRAGDFLAGIISAGLDRMVEDVYGMMSGGKEEKDDTD